MAGETRMAILHRRASPDCPLFKLSAELRNQIYKLVFEISNEDIIHVTDDFLPPSQSPSGTATSIRVSAPPSAALIGCCQTIYEESKGIFDEASKSYWKKEFVLEFEHIRQTPDVKHLLDSIPTYRMDKLVVRASVVDHETFRYALWRDSAGHWNCVDLAWDGSIPHYMYVPSSPVRIRGYRLREILYCLPKGESPRSERQPIHCPYGYWFEGEKIARLKSRAGA